MNFVITKPEISQEEFLRHLIEQFPALKSEVEDEDYQGLIHLQVACLAWYTNTCVAAGRIDEVRRILNFFHQMMEKVDTSTENALYVSFLEHLELDANNTQEAKKLLKPKYLDIYQELRKI
jgi:hypothetical protein